MLCYKLLYQTATISDYDMLYYDISCYVIVELFPRPPPPPGRLTRSCVMSYHSPLWYGIVCYGMAKYGILWYGLLCCVM